MLGTFGLIAAAAFTLLCYRFYRVLRDLDNLEKLIISYNQTMAVMQ